MQYLQPKTVTNRICELTNFNLKAPNCEMVITNLDSMDMITILGVITR